MAEIKCGTCKHYEAAPMWKKGWCRNPLLYSMQQSHLVGEDDLDCNRGMGSYWEPIESESFDEEPLTSRFTPPPARTIAPAAPIGRSRGETRAAPARQSRPVMPPPATVSDRSRPASPLASTTTETYATVPVATSLGAYIRRGYPVIGIMLLLGAFWVWSSAQLGRRAESINAPLPTAAAANATVAIIVPSPTAGPPPGAAQPPTPPPPGVLAPGAKAVVASGGAGANIRQEPTVSAPAVTAVSNGTILQITGPSQDAGGYTWWPVTGDGFTGWIAGALIQPAP